MARKVFGASLRNAMERGAEAARPDDVVIEAKTSPTVARAQASVIDEDKHSTRLLDPNLVRMSAVMDRIDPADGIEDLVDSIREHGQKVAILVRKVEGGGFEIVYGRRRLLACKLLGVKVRASVMEMSDEDALIAQGVENNARIDPSFIERAIFVAGIIRELGKTEQSRKSAQTIAYRALGIDESLVSRMNRIASTIPMALIKAIGPAHGSGRRAWERLAKLCEMDRTGSQAIIDRIPTTQSGGDRLEAAIQLLSASEPPAPPADTLDQDRIRLYRRGGKLTVEADPAMLPQIEEAIRKLLHDLLNQGQTPTQRLSGGEQS